MTAQEVETTARNIRAQWPDLGTGDVTTIAVAVEEACLPERVCLEFAQDVAMLLMCMADEDGHWTE